jgi:hypothetical protein
VSARAALAVATCLALAVAGCSTTHQPRDTARIGVFIRNGGAYFTKSGKLTPVGPFAGSLDELMAPASPEAARLARRGTTQLRVGIPMYIAGFAGVVLSLAVISGDARWPVAAAGALSFGTGLSLMGAGFTNLIDSVNVHNDAVEAQSDAYRR